VFFNAGRNEQVFLLNPEKNLAQIHPSCRFEKNANQFRKNDVTEQRLGYSNNQLNCFTLSKTIWIKLYPKTWNWLITC